MNAHDRHPTLRARDPELAALIDQQIDHESTTLKMIPSESFAPLEVLEACGSMLTNKYCEGYPFARYYEGNEFVDQIESLAIERAKQCFGAEHANVQPYSGSPANQAVYRALCTNGSAEAAETTTRNKVKVMALSLPLGGHLTHGWKASFSGQDFQQIPYEYDLETGAIDFDQVRELAKRERPRMIWVGASSYPRLLDYSKFAEIAQEVEAYLVADMAHINALIVAGVHPDPVPYCDVVTSTSHKMLCGPRAGFILSKQADRWKDLYHPTSKMDLAKRLDNGVFPTLQGGPHVHVMAAMATAFRRAMTPEFKAYGRQIVANAKHLAEKLMERGHRLATGGTDNHIVLIDLRASEHTGKDFAKALAKCGIIGNFNMVPGDQRKPFVTSGVRLGTPSLTGMGMKEKDMERVAAWIDEVYQHIDDIDAVATRIQSEIKEFCDTFKIPGIRE